MITVSCKKVLLLAWTNQNVTQDIVILLDTSGSMTGLRKEIAKHVVINIMETLGEDDFVTVLTFSDETKPLVECFTDSDGEAELVQATNENIAEFTEAIDNIETMEIANFTSALTAAFTLLERYRTKKVRTLLPPPLATIALSLSKYLK